MQTKRLFKFYTKIHVPISSIFKTYCRDAKKSQESIIDTREAPFLKGPVYFAVVIIVFDPPLSNGN